MLDVLCVGHASYDILMAGADSMQRSGEIDYLEASKQFARHYCDTHDLDRLLEQSGA